MFRKFLAAALGVFLFGVGQAEARAVYCVNCSEQWTQAAERVTSIQKLNQMYSDYREYVEQTAHLLENVHQNITMIKDMQHNTIGLPSEIIGKIYDEMTRLAKVTNALNTIRADIEGTEKIYDEYYKAQAEYKKLANLPNDMLSERNVTIRADIDKMGERIDEATKATFQLSGSQLRDLEESGKMEDYINDLVNNADGRNEMLQAGNQLAKLQYSEARQLRELVATTIQSNLATQVRDEKERQIEEEMKRIIHSTYEDPVLNEYPDLF